MKWTCPRCGFVYEWPENEESHRSTGGVHCPIGLGGCGYHDKLDGAPVEPIDPEKLDRDCNNCDKPIVIRTHRDKNGHRTGLAAGDVVVLTSAVESFAKFDPRRTICVDTMFPEIFANNPHVTRTVPDDHRVVHADYDLIQRSNQEPLHFIDAYCHQLKLKAIAPRRRSAFRSFFNRPYLYLSDEERATKPPVDGPFWIMSTGTSALTNKQWPVEHYQTLRNLTADRIQWIQTGEGPRINGALDLRGQTTLRDFIVLTSQASGAVGPSTLLQHLMAAWQKPYCLLLGGREPVSWTAYPLQHTFHTIGRIGCCFQNACWKSRVVELPDRAEQNGSLCEMPVADFRRWQKPHPRCMGMITPEEVACVISRIA